MAQTKTRTKTAPEPTPAPFSFENVQVGEAEVLPKGVKQTKPNPLLSAVEAALDGPARYLEVPGGEQAAQAEGFLRRAGQAIDASVKVRYADGDDKPLNTAQAHTSTEPVFVYFQVSSDKPERTYTKRAYTTDDVRKFHGLAEGAKVTTEHRRAYREAHNLPVR